MSSSDGITVVTVAMHGRHLICVCCRSKSEEKLELFRMHQRLVKVALSTACVEHFHVDRKSSQEWQDLQRDLGPYLRPKDYIRVGRVAAGAFQGLRAVGIGSRDKALRRALNVALALSVVRQRPFAPEALRRLLRLNPIPVMGGGSVPVKAKPAVPPPLVNTLEVAKRESANVKPASRKRSRSSSPEAKDVAFSPQWLPQLAQLVTAQILPRIERLEQMGRALPVPGSENSDPAELSAAPEEEVDYTGDSDVAPDAPDAPDAEAVCPVEPLESTKDVKLDDQVQVKMEPMDPVEAAKLQDASGLDADGTTELFVDEVRYSQQSCCDRLRNGKVVSEEVEKIVKGDIDPLQEDWLKIEVFQMKSFQTHQMTYYSSDNRRLLILKTAQERLPGRLKLRAKVERVPPCFRKFMSHFNTRNDGKSIRVKSPKSFLGSFKRSRGRTRF